MHGSCKPVIMLHMCDTSKVCTPQHASDCIAIPLSCSGSRSWANRDAHQIVLLFPCPAPAAAPGHTAAHVAAQHSVAGKQQGGNGLVQSEIRDFAEQVPTTASWPLLQHCDEQVQDWVYRKPRAEAGSPNTCQMQDKKEHRTEIARD